LSPTSARCRPRAGQDRGRAPVEGAEVVLRPVRVVLPILLRRSRTSSGLAVAPLFGATDLGRGAHVAVGLPGELALAGRDAGLLGVLGVERVVMDADPRLGEHRP